MFSGHALAGGPTCRAEKRSLIAGKLRAARFAGRFLTDGVRIESYFALFCQIARPMQVRTFGVRTLASASPPGRKCSVGHRASCLEASICRHAADSSPSPWGEGRGEVASKAEARSPKAERRPSSEIRRPKPGAEGDSGFGLLSAFGLRICPSATLQTRFQFPAALDVFVRSRNLGNPEADKWVLSHPAPALVFAEV